MRVSTIKEKYIDIDNFMIWLSVTDNRAASKAEKNSYEEESFRLFFYFAETAFMGEKQ